MIIEYNIQSKSQRVDRQEVNNHENHMCFLKQCSRKVPPEEFKNVVKKIILYQQIQ